MNVVCKRVTIIRFSGLSTFSVYNEIFHYNSLFIYNILSSTTKPQPSDAVSFDFPRALYRYIRPPFLYYNNNDYVPDKKYPIVETHFYKNVCQYTVMYKRHQCSSHHYTIVLFQKNHLKYAAYFITKTHHGRTLRIISETYLC